MKYLSQLTSDSFIIDEGKSANRSNTDEARWWWRWLRLESEGKEEGGDFVISTKNTQIGVC